MQYTFQGQNQGFLHVASQAAAQSLLLANQPGTFIIAWCQEGSFSFQADGLPQPLATHQLMALTPNQHLSQLQGQGQLVVFAFNREFYCVLDHDHEVSCSGLLFFGSHYNPLITLEPAEQDKFDLLYKVFVDELTTQDNIQGQMLQMLLKRLIIKVTRLFKNQSNDWQQLAPAEQELIRQFYILVEMHYKSNHQVAQYADMLFKSPKTLSNAFAKYSTESPLQVIHNRLVLEAKRLLTHTPQTARQIAFELGFEDPTHFSRLFKKGVGQGPQAYRKAHAQHNTSKEM